MGSKTVRMLMCAALAATLGAFGTAARAIPISVAFDPPVDFEGILTLDAPPSCFTPDGVHSCAVSFLTVDFTDFAGNHWVTGTTPDNQTIPVEIVGGAFFAFQATLTSPFLALTGDTNGCDGTQQLIFELPSESNDDQRRVTFSCLGVVGDNVGTYTTSVVPEPGTLVLLGLGLTGFAASRRRKLK